MGRFRNLSYNKKNSIPKDETQGHECVDCLETETK